MNIKSISMTILLVGILFSGCLSAFASDGTQTATNGAMPAMNVSNTIEERGSNYIPENDSVRYRSGVIRTAEEGRPAGEKATYSVVSFETWGDSKAAPLAAAEVREQLTDRLPGSSEKVDVLVHSDGSNRSINVAYIITKDTDGSVINTPNFEFDTLVHKVPSEVTATVSLEGNQYTATYDVTVKRMELKQS